MPLAGEVIEVNSALEGDPALVNKDPYGAGWLVRLRVDDWAAAEAQLLRNAAVPPAFEAAMNLENFAAGTPT